MRTTDVLDFAALRRICEVCRGVHFHDEKPGEEMGFFGMKLDQREEQRAKGYDAMPGWV